MGKKTILVPVTLLAIAGITGCSTKEEARDSVNNMTENVGYYTNHKEEKGNAILLDEQAPVPHMMNDYNGYYEGREKERLEHDGNPTVPISDRDQGWFRQDGDYNRDDKNYHNHLVTTRPARASYYTAYEGRLAEKLSQAAEKDDNVKAARSVINGNKAMIAVLITDFDKSQETKQRLEKQLKPLAGDKKVYILTDSGVYYYVQSLDNGLRDGGGSKIDQMKADNMLKDLSNHLEHSE
ncbi:YhcN/YlaJ family sporulation lipoprotein [Peribacillus acanthi]|uniref:YhcN/YlaJ family sporulation lipoprotein n=1 Tax=Peribacillus acanthi TaxID=2171554 RepID=UPI000D3E1EEA|nr:YhcN/YlaJ family sporulation lipoprotein [Peribacillus acanthi]